MINKIKSIPSFCTSNKEVLNSIMVFAKIYNLPLLIETTSNQVNQFGGYSKLTPRKFYNKIMKMTERFNLNKNRVRIGADHLGPLPWAKKNEKIAIKNSIRLFRDCVKTGFKKIHIDTGMNLKNDRKLNKNIIIERCRKIYFSCTTDKFKKIDFIFGTEVPAAGGSKKFKLMQTSLDSIKDDVKEYKKLRKNFSLVIEPGLSFTNNKAYKLNMVSFKKKLKFSKKLKFFYEAHSTDYQSLGSLKKLVNNNFLYLKVGPEMTYSFMRAVLFLEKLEKKYFFSKISNIRKIISLEMDKKNIYWKDYYKGNIRKKEFLKFYSLLDRSRYYWTNKKVLSSLTILKKNVNSIKIGNWFSFYKISKKEFANLSSSIAVLLYW